MQYKLFCKIVNIFVVESHINKYTLTCIKNRGECCRDVVVCKILKFHDVLHQTKEHIKLQCIVQKRFQTHHSVLLHVITRTHDIVLQPMP